MNGTQLTHNPESVGHGTGLYANRFNRHSLLLPAAALRLSRQPPEVQAAKRTGIPLKQVKAHLDKLPSGPVSPAEWEVLSAEWHALLDERIHRLEQLRDEMAGCIGCGCLSLKDCPLRNPGDVLRQEGTGAQLLAE